MIQLLPSTAAMAINLTKSFLAIDGTPPYTYSILPPPPPSTAAGGTIDPVTGIYTSPPVTGQDLILVTDSTLATAQALVTVGNALELFCDILQQELSLAPGRVYVWDQLLLQPKDPGLYIAVAAATPKCFGQSKRYDGSGSGLVSMQSSNWYVNLNIDLISRGPDARDRKEEVVMALQSDYAESQMNANAFYIARLPNQFVNLSSVDGSLIPYRYNTSVAIQYALSKTENVDYYSTVPDATVTTEP